MEINWEIRYDPYGELISITDAGKVISSAYRLLPHPRQPKEIKVNTFGIGLALYDYLKSEGLPVTNVHCRREEHPDGKGYTISQVHREIG